MPQELLGPRTSSKIDPRLALLLGLGAERRGALWRHERAQLRTLAQRLAEARNSGIRREIEALHSRLFAPITTGYHEPSSGDEGRISAFIVAGCSAADLRALGAEVRSQSGDVFTAFIPLSKLEAIAASSAVRHVELARAVFPQLDVAVPHAQVDVLHGPPANATGKNVVVAICDSTLDLYHPDFRDPATNKTRVRFLWDQTLTPVAGESTPAAMPFAVGTAPAYGVEYDAAAIDAQLAAFTGSNAYDLVRHNAQGEPGSHGTAVACIAAGNGREQSSTGVRYVGAAPDADIIFVAQPDLYTSGVLADITQVADAFAYAFDRAARLGRPCVANMSNGDNLGPHDGTAWGEQFLDGLLDVPGRAITLSAGNSTNTKSHAVGTVPDGGDKRLTLRCQAGADKSDAMQIWYDGHDRFQVTVTLPTAAAPLGPMAPGSPAAQATLPNGVVVQLTSDLAMANNGDNLIELILAVPAGAQIPAGDILIDLHGTSIVNGAFHAWVDRNNRPKLAFPADFDESALTLGTPGTARRAITVGNHNRVMPPAIAGSSGRGPTRDGRVKPDVAATGVNVRTAVSRNRNLAAQPGPNYDVFNGTSASAPLVAGACACLLQCRGPATTWAHLQQILASQAGNAGLLVPDNGFGFGYALVGQGCSAAVPACDVWLRDDAADTGQEPFTGAVAWLSPDIEVLDMNRAPAANPVHTASNAVNNIIRVTVRNRGAQAALNTEVYLYWADPATYIPFPGAWNAQGIYTAVGGAFVNQANMVVVPQLGPGQSAAVEFGFAPPAPGSNIRGDDHFCLVVRVENAADPSGVGTGGWAIITARNNIALRNLHVLKLAQSRRARTRFLVAGTADRDSLRVTRELAAGDITLRLALRSLPWRDAAPDASSGPARELDGAAIARLTGITGVRRAVVSDGIATLFVDGAEPLWIPDVRLRPGETMPVMLQVDNAHAAGDRRFVHVAQRSGGRLVGGVSVELRMP